MATVATRAVYEKGPYLVTITEEQLARDGFGDEGTPLYKVLIVEVGGEAAGFCLYFHTYSTWQGRCLYLEDLFVVDWDKTSRDWYERVVGGRVQPEWVTYRMYEPDFKAFLQSMPAVAVREAKREDVPLIYKFIQELAIYEKEPHAVKITEEQLARDGFGDEGAPLYKVLIAEVGGEAAGFCLYFYTYSTWQGRCLYLEDLFVREKFRGCGAGTALFAALARQCVELSCARLVWQVLDWNKPSRDWYERVVGGRAQPEWVTYRLYEPDFKAFLQRVEASNNSN
eukprot:m51a1_g227 putative gcn5 family n-acetyltransferase (283) ;mRNA; r:92693-94518